MCELNLAKEIAKKVNSKGGHAYFVGGYVRDKIRNISNDDIDIEIHGLSADDLEEILSLFGHVNKLGKSFGIYKIEHSNLDIALPRSEKKIGIGHRGFDVDIDPFLGTKTASKRRDFTINSIMEDILTSEIIDHYQGIEDLNMGIIRHVDDNSFVEDPLRVLRACQFSSRFGFQIAKETIELCKKINLKELSKERVFLELSKALEKSEKPSTFFENLDKMGHLDYWFREVKEMSYIEQSPIHHSEGNVYIHTMMVVDAASKYKDRVDSPLAFMLAALCHDMGKIESTQVIDGKIHSYHHEIVGIEVAKRFLNRLTNDKFIHSYVANMTEHHMKPNMYANDNSKISSTNRMFFKSLDPIGLIYLAMADDEGRKNVNTKVSPEKYLFERLEIFKDYMARPYVEGKDLLKYDFIPKEMYGKILEFSNKLRMSGVEKSLALSQTLAFAKQEINKSSNK